MNQIATGFHTTNHSLFTLTAPESSGTVYNIVTAMDYIPGVSVISGLARTILSALTLCFGGLEANKKRSFYGQLARGIISTLCLGIFLAPFDLYVTFSAPKMENSSSIDQFPEIFSGTKQQL